MYFGYFISMFSFGVVMLSLRYGGRGCVGASYVVGMYGSSTSVLVVCAKNAVKVVRGPRANSLRTFGFRRLRRRMPRLGGLKCGVSSVRFSPPVSSSRVKPSS